MIYRKCLNSECGQVFQVLSSKSKKRYCSTYCKNFHYKIMHLSDKDYYRIPNYYKLKKNYEKPFNNQEKNIQ